MEPIPTSFIPKRPVTSELLQEHPSGRAVGLLSLLTVVVVVATIISFIGVYLYEQSLAGQKAKLEQSINDARNGIGTDFLADMKRLNSRISGVKTLLAGHIVVSPIFAALESTTLRSVQYRSFTYEFRTDSTSKAQVVQVSLSGVAKNYSTIALQSDAFTQSSLIKNPVFSGLTVDDKTSNVAFKLTFDVSPSDLSFQSFIDAKKGTGQVTLPPSGTTVQ